MVCYPEALRLHAGGPVSESPPVQPFTMRERRVPMHPEKRSVDHVSYYGVSVV